MVAKEKKGLLTTFKVKSGYHNDGETTYRKGQTFTSDKPLHKAFANKFEIVATGEKAIVKKTLKGGEKKKSRYKDVDPLENIGKEVSQKFPDAINQGLRVYQTEDGEYNVTSEQDLYTPLNSKPMTRLKTKKFIDNQ